MCQCLPTIFAAIATVLLLLSNKSSAESDAEKYLAYSSSKCFATNDTSVICRFNDDCCSGLCTTGNYYVSGDPPRCVDNVAENHHADSFTTKKALLLSSDFVRNTYPGMNRFRDKVAVVTGAASGLGFALARRLCNEGMIVVGADKNEHGVKKVADHCPANKYYSFKIDLRNEAEIVNLFRYVNETVGRVDVLINNAGVCRKTTLYGASGEAMRTLLDTNVLAPIFCTREALKIMLADKESARNGHILFTNSIEGGMLQDPPYGEVTYSLMPYAVSKHALRVATEGLRRELRAKGLKIRIGQVAPNPMHSNIPDSFIPRDMTDAKVIEKIFGNPGIRTLQLADPDEIAESFLYLLTVPEHLDANIVEFRDFPK